jgi:hypothetical protein
MPTSIYRIDPPVDGLTCRNCSDPIIATAKVFGGGMTISGLCQYRWTHVHGSDVCRPTTSAQPFDGWQATAHVEAVLDARQAAEEALECAESGQPTVPLS